jgi:hypothetical protein
LFVSFFLSPFLSVFLSSFLSPHTNTDTADHLFVHNGTTNITPLSCGNKQTWLLSLKAIHRRTPATGGARLLTQPDDQQKYKVQQSFTEHAKTLRQLKT